jgi:hypothetical protein
VSGHAAVFGEVFHAVYDRLLAAVREHGAGVFLEVPVAVVVERLLEVKRLAAARMAEI